MIGKGFKSGFLVLLLVVSMGKEFHTHAEIEISNLSHESYSSHQETKTSPTCPICQFQRESHSFWNPDFLIRSSFPVLQTEKFPFSRIFVLSFDLDPIRLGRAPPLSLPLI
ncbi:LIC10965 family protein [Leptospira sanjuanensis]|uniref:LIC10965 family protein n=1 Tax=Leptospira sanjuanensis TaxID=2879643 RepID=UPI003872F705